MPAYPAGPINTQSDVTLLLNGAAESVNGRLIDVFNSDADERKQLWLLAVDAHISSFFRQQFMLSQRPVDPNLLLQTFI